IFVMGAKGVLYGFIVLCMQNIIHVTASDENEPLCLPEAGDIIGVLIQLGATILISFAVPIAFFIGHIFFDIEMPMSAIIAAMVFGCLYFPMAFLAVAMKDTALAANPLIVIPAILKIPLEYFVTATLLVAVFGLWQLGNILSDSSISITTRDMSVLMKGATMKAVWTLITVYILTVF